VKKNILITKEPIQPSPAPIDAGSGAVVTFSGVVRDQEETEPILGLFYEVYQPMAENVIHQILQELSAKHPCTSAEVTHRYGLIPAGETSLWIRVCAPHRAEAFGLVTEFVDRLKKEVPIWKTKP